MMGRSFSTVQGWGTGAARQRVAQKPEDTGIAGHLAAAYSATAARALQAPPMTKAFEKLEGLCAIPLIYVDLKRQNSIVAFATKVRVADGIT
jgi:hypothetical protein